MTSRILFVHNHPTTFVKTDLALFRERYAVREWYQRTRGVNLPALARAVADSDLTFGWFASWHTFFPLWLARVLKRPSVLVVGGYDTANLPEIGYGSQRGGIRRRIARTTMGWARELITNSSYARNEAISNARVNPANVTVVYHGWDGANFSANSKAKSVAITVGTVDHGNLKRKGLEPFVRAATYLPDVMFVVIGAWRDDSINYLRALASPNVLFTGWVNDRQLHDYISRARVYVQASRHEGFGLSVAEAMLAECVPVVTRAGALPEVVGETGVYLDSTEPTAVASGVRRALKLEASRGTQARERVIREFPLARRRDGLYEVVEKALGEHGRIPVG